METLVSADWTSQSFRAALAAMVRRRVPERDVEDVVQSALTDAVLSNDRPPEPEAARRWLWAVTRNKIVDYHRKTRRERLEEHPEPEARPDSHARPNEVAERELLRWAVGELPEGADAQRTFEWLLREGDGEKLEEIAERENLPAPAVRQRVSRMRRFFRERWAVQAALLGLMVLALWALSRRDKIVHPRITPDPVVLTAEARARVLRQEALRLCSEQRWQRCLDGLNAARALDARGDNAPEVQSARRAAANALVPERAPVPRSSPVPSPSPVPTPTPAPRPSPAPSPTVSDGFGNTGTGSDIERFRSIGLGSMGSDGFPVDSPTSRPRRRPRTAVAPPRDGGF